MSDYVEQPFTKAPVLNPFAEVSEANHPCFFPTLRISLDPQPESPFISANARLQDFDLFDRARLDGHDRR